MISRRGLFGLLAGAAAAVGLGRKAEAAPKQYVAFTVKKSKEELMAEWGRAQGRPWQPPDWSRMEGPPMSVPDDVQVGDLLVGCTGQRWVYHHDCWIIFEGHRQEHTTERVPVIYGVWDGSKVVTNGTVHANIRPSR